MKFRWAKGYEKEKNRTFAFVYRAERDLRFAALRMCGAQEYRVWRGEKLVGYGPARTAHGYARVDRYELGVFRCGEQLTVEVSAHNVRCLSEAGMGPYFAAEVISEEKLVADTDDFRCFSLTDRVQKVLRFSFQRAFTERYDMSFCRTRLYGGDLSAYPEVPLSEVGERQLLERAAAYPLFWEYDYGAPIERGIISRKEEFTVWRDRAHNITPIFDGFPLETLEADASADVSALAFTPAEGTGSRYAAGEYGIYISRRTLSGFFSLRVHAEEDCEFYILFDEIDSREITGGKGGIEVNFYRNDCCNVIEYKLRKGDYALLTFQPNSARYVRLCAVGGQFDVEHFGMVTCENPQAYNLRCSMPGEYADIFRAAQNTFAQNIFDVPMDCPSRERAGWLCDAMFSGRAEGVLTGSNAVERSFLENYVLSPQLKELPEGMLPMCYPGDFPNSDHIPTYALWFIVHLYDYVRRTGDKSLLAAGKPKVYGVLRHFSGCENEFGLLEDLKGWVFIEWSDCNRKDYVCGVNFPANILYKRALECAGELFEDKDLLCKAKKVKEGVLRFGFDGEYFADNAVRGEDGKLVRCADHLTETCQYYAFFFGVADRKTHAPLYRRLKEEFGAFRGSLHPEVAPSNAFMGFIMRLDLLRQEGDYARLLREVEKYYAAMAQKTGTLWEHKNIGNSLDHGFTSYIAVFLLQALGYIGDPFVRRK